MTSHVQGAPTRAGGASSLRVATDGDASLGLGRPSPPLARPPERRREDPETRSKRPVAVGGLRGGRNVTQNVDPYRTLFYDSNHSVASLRSLSDMNRKAVRFRSEWVSDFVGMRSEKFKFGEGNSESDDPVRSTAPMEEPDPLENYKP